MVGRYRDEGASIYAFADEFLVRCPRCEGRARVAGRQEDDDAAWWLRRRRLTCTACGHAADWPGGSIAVGEVCDWFFRLPLWLQTPCCGETLWAYNRAHLDELERYVRADLRERLPDRNASLASRLPTWMTSAKNRDEVLRGLARLRALLA